MKNLIDFMQRQLFAFKRRNLIRGQILEIAQYANQPVEQVEALFRNRNLVDEAWQKANPRTEKEILQFYAKAKAYIYADMRWNATNPQKYNSRFILLDFC